MPKTMHRYTTAMYRPGRPMCRWLFRYVVYLAFVPAGLLLSAAGLGAEPASAVASQDDVPEFSVTTGDFQPARLDKTPADECIRGANSRAPEHISTPECQAMDAVEHGAEGWVTLSTMVDATGKPFEAAVVESSGNPILEEVALRKAEKSRYRPALENGKPIESAVGVKYLFVVSGATGARPDFIRAYKALENAVTAQDRGAADLRLQELKVTNLYEDAYLGVAHFQYAKLWGTHQEQRGGLARAILNDGVGHYLPPDLRQSILFAFFNLEVQDHLYPEAIKTAARIQKLKLDSKTTQAFKGVLEQIQKVRSDGSSYDVKIQISESGSYNISLFKHHFRIAVDRGGISQVKLRCQKHFASFDFNPALEYEYSSKDGDCSMEVIGAPGSQFTVTQF
jgi:TonB family protein